MYTISHRLGAIVLGLFLFVATASSSFATFIDASFWAGSPTTTDIANKVFGPDYPHVASCTPGTATVVTVDGSNPIPMTLASDTIYVLEPGTHDLPFVASPAGTAVQTVQGNAVSCVAIIAKPGASVQTAGYIQANHTAVADWANPGNIPGRRGMIHFVNSDRIVLDGFTVDAGVGADQNHVGVMFHNSTDFHMHAMTVIDALFVGVLLQDSNTAAIDTLVSNDHGNGLIAASGRPWNAGFGLEIWNSSDIAVSDASFDNNYVGFEIWGTDWANIPTNITWDGGSTTNNRLHGIWFDELADNVEISNVTVANNAIQGIKFKTGNPAVMVANNVTLRDMMIYDHGNTAIQIDGGRNILLNNIALFNNDKGLVIGGGATMGDITVANSALYNNRVGVSSTRTNPLVIRSSLVSNHDGTALQLGDNARIVDLVMVNNATAINGVGAVTVHGQMDMIDNDTDTTGTVNTTAATINSFTDATNCNVAVLPATDFHATACDARGVQTYTTMAADFAGLMYGIAVPLKQDVYGPDLMTLIETAPTTEYVASHYTPTYTKNVTHSFTVNGADVFVSSGVSADTCVNIAATGAITADATLGAQDYEPLQGVQLALSLGATPMINTVDGELDTTTETMARGTTIPAQSLGLGTYTVTSSLSLPYDPHGTPASSTATFDITNSGCTITPTTAAVCQIPNPANPAEFIPVIEFNKHVWKMGMLNPRPGESAYMLAGSPLVGTSIVDPRMLYYPEANNPAMGIPVPPFTPIPTPPFFMPADLMMGRQYTQYQTAPFDFTYVDVASGPAATPVTVTVDGTSPLCATQPSGMQTFYAVDATQCQITVGADTYFGMDFNVPVDVVANLVVNDISSGTSPAAYSVSTVDETVILFDQPNTVVTDGEVSFMTNTATAAGSSTNILSNLATYPACY